ncbi:hypothetical protein DFA_09621 [Cavenderia fasciculata]|uniref:ComC supersandwich domain-containing protein n=1 Tax=Cavenderia fasciculata TaxID=261658 RepID=F4Q850_CACFS|nr:uncharacterized protein DFA_09621 [Cavenderia fasciculata]EGG15950.1 hypothetical protein DFA_09621 [Cavenderia fasciculata]|eukprot:XP_004352275.1 hypothetical protein DFA_09621 [Cavenderia fasciculata]
MYKLTTTTRHQSRGGSHWIILILLTVSLLCGTSISQSLNQAESDSVTFILQQYGIAIIPSLICQTPQYFTCLYNTSDEQYHLTQIIFAGLGAYVNWGTPTLQSLDLPELNTFKLVQSVGRQVTNPSINILEYLKPLKSLQNIYIENDPTITYVPPDFTDFPRLSLFSLNSPGLTSLPSTLLNNSAVSILHIYSPVQSMIIGPTLYLPQLSSLRITVNCTGPSHSINITSKSFPMLMSLDLYTAENANITIHHNLNRQFSIICLGMSLWNPGQCNLRIGNPSVITTLALAGPNSTFWPAPITSTTYPILFHLVLENMGLTNFPIVGSYPPLLSILNLRYNRLLSIPFIPQSLRQLDLDGNDLTTLDLAMIGSHTGLEVLRVSNNTLFVGPITDAYCAHELNVLYTLVDSLPDCFWCYINASFVGPYVQTSLTFPSKFYCNVTIDNADNIITNNGKYMLTGQNLGFGNEEGNVNYTLSKVVANSKLEVAFKVLSMIPTNFTLNLVPYDTEPQKQITVVEGGVEIVSLSLQTFINGTSNAVTFIFLKVTFNGYFLHYGQVDSRNCSFFIYFPPDQQMCVMNDLTIGSHSITFFNDHYSTSRKFDVSPYPVLNSIRPLPTTIGSMITLSGNFGPSQTNITVKFKSDNSVVSICTIASFTPSTIVCQVASPLIDQIEVAVSDGINTGSLLVTNQYICQQSTDYCHGNGLCNTVGQCDCNSNGYYNNCSKPYPIISSGSYNATNNKMVTINGDFGPNIDSIEIISIKINNTLDCTVYIKSQTLITCDLEKTPNYGLSSVQVQLDSLNTSAKNVLYLRQPDNGGNNGLTTTATTTSGGSTPDTPQQLCEKQTSNCYGHGVCDVNGKCQCEDNYNPDDECFTKFINTTITPNTTSPTVSFDIDGIDFQFEVVSVQELDCDSNIIKELFISNYTWIVNASTNNITTIVDYQLNTTLPSSSSSTDINSILFQSVSVLSTISFSSKPRDIQFGDQKLHINPNSIKLAINITNWQYSSNLATLRVVFRTIIINNQTVEYDCNEKEVDALSYDSLSSLQYLRVIKDDIQFNGRFIDVALSNGRPTYSQTQLISLTQPSSNEDESIALIGINLPQCQSCVLDPDFSPLLIDKSNDSGCDSKSNNWRIIVGVVVGGFGAIAITAAAIIAIKKTQAKIRINQKMQMKLQEMN